MMAGSTPTEDNDTVIVANSIVEAPAVGPSTDDTATSAGADDHIQLPAKEADKTPPEGDAYISQTTTVNDGQKFQEASSPQIDGTEIYNAACENLKKVFRFNTEYSTVDVDNLDKINKMLAEFKNLDCMLTK
jgi:hypothetical protein